MYNVYVTKVKNIRPAENADRLNLCEVFGNTTVVDKSVNETDLYLYFPVDGQISVEFGEANNLFRKKDAEGKQVGGFIDPEKRNICAIRLRGNKSDGLVLPLTALESFGDISNLKEGDVVTTFNGHEIACKYIPIIRASKVYSQGNKARKKKVPLAPLFMEHADTEQLAYNLASFKPEDEIEITLKMHGTSQRTAHLPVLTGYKRTFLDKLLRREGTPCYEWGYVTGTRRVVLDIFDGGFYGSNEFREAHANVFEGKLWKGETVYYEVVGFTHTGAPIMGVADNKKMNDKDFIKQYGKTTTFSYGCEPNGYKEAATGSVTVMAGDKVVEKTTYFETVEAPQSDIYVYRMTMTNEDGAVVEYTPDFMRYRCEQMGVKCVPVLWSGRIPAHPGSKDDPTISAGEWIQNVAEMYYDGPDPVGKTHVREGVVVRILNRPKFCAYKHKNFEFKVLEGLIKADAVNPDMEEAQEVTE